MSTLQEFLQMANSRDFLVLDTETTGLHDGEICQIAVIDWVGDVLIDCLVKTVRPIPAGATAIHGITDAMVADAPYWKDLRAALADLLKGRDVVVYNAVYDRKMMHQSSEKAGLSKIEWKELATFWCAMEAYAEFHGDFNEYRGSYTWQSLTSACGQLKLPHAKAHSALGDCLATLAVVNKMVESFAPDIVDIAYDDEGNEYLLS